MTVVRTSLLIWIGLVGCREPRTEPNAPRAIDAEVRTSEHDASVADAAMPGASEPTSIRTTRAPGVN